MLAAPSAALDFDLSLVRGAFLCRRIGSPRFLDNSRQPDHEGRALTRLALDRDVAAHHLTEAFADREPKPGAAVFARRRCVGLRELLKQLVHLLRRHADSGVGHRQRDPGVSFFERKGVIELSSLAHALFTN